MDFVRSDERLPLNLEAERLALQLGDWPKALRARARLFFDYLELGELGQADQSLARYVELARELESERHLWPIPLFHGLRACMQGRFAEAEAALAEAAQRGERAADPGRHWMLTFHRLGLERAREGHGALLALEPDIRAALGPSPPGELWSALVTASGRARVGQAREAAALLASQDLERLLEASDLTSLGMLAEVIASIENRELAARVYPLLLPLQGRLFCYGMMGVFCEAPDHWHRQAGGAPGPRHGGEPSLRECHRHLPSARAPAPPGARLVRACRGTGPLVRGRGGHSGRRERGAGRARGGGADCGRAGAERAAAQHCLAAPGARWRFEWAESGPRTGSGRATGVRAAPRRRLLDHRGAGRPLAPRDMRGLHLLQPW